MFEKLKDLLKNSYAKYSNYRVSAIIVTKDGKEFNGVNIENASYGATICAERSAISNAISNGYKDFKELYVMVDSNIIAPPCFICRQVISELCDKDMDIICMNNVGEQKRYKVSELCVYPFSEDNLR
ncbi:MAG: cytidine deaminase [Bacilli bacterium]|nr:cytidine deaminase [Bacilli bacterium]